MILAPTASVIVNSEFKNILFDSKLIWFSDADWYQRLFQAVLKQLKLAKRWQDRLISLRQNKKYFNEILKRLETNKDIDENEFELD